MMRSCYAHAQKLTHHILKMTLNCFGIIILQYLVCLNSYSAKFVAAMMAGRCCITLCMLAVLANTGT